MPPAPETEIETETTVDGLPAGSPRDVMKSWMTGVESLTVEAPPPDKPKDQNGKADTSGRSDAPAPGAKPPVVPDPDAKPADKPLPVAGGDKGGEPAKPDEGKDTRAEDWSKLPAPKDKKEWNKFTTLRGKEQDLFKQEIKERDTKLSELQAKVAELETSAKPTGEPPPEIKTQLERLAAENKELSDRLTALNVTEHPKFKAYFNEKIDAAISRAKKLVGAESAETIESILKMPDSDFKTQRLEDFMSSVESDLIKTRLGDVLDRLDDINAEREAEIAKANKHSETLTGQQVAKTEQAKAARDAAYNGVVKQLTDPKNGFAAFQMREGDAAWNEAVQKRLSAAKGLLTADNINPDTVIRAAHYAVALPAVLQSWQAESEAWTKEKAGYEAKIAELVKAQPTAGSGHQETKGDASKIKLNKEDKPWQISKKWAEAAAAAANE